MYMWIHADRYDTYALSIVLSACNLCPTHRYLVRSRYGYILIPSEQEWSFPTRRLRSRPAPRRRCFNPRRAGMVFPMLTAPLIDHEGKMFQSQAGRNGLSNLGRKFEYFIVFWRFQSQAGRNGLSNQRLFFVVPTFLGGSIPGGQERSFQP